MPCTESSLFPAADPDLLHDKRVFHQGKTLPAATASSLPPLALQSEVLCQELGSNSRGRWKLKATILDKINDRTYKVITEDGKVYIRNRKFLRPIFFSAKDLVEDIACKVKLASFATSVTFRCSK